MDSGKRVVQLDCSPLVHLLRDRTEPFDVTGAGFLARFMSTQMRLDPGIPTRLGLLKTGILTPRT
jgi:hypothetical protein